MERETRQPNNKKSNNNTHSEQKTSNTPLSVQLSAEESSRSNISLAKLSELRGNKISERLPGVLPRDMFFHVAIIGGGIGGCRAAIELAKMKHLDGKPIYQISLIEKKSELMSATSSITPGRLGQGYHYADPRTAEMYRERTRDFMKQYPGCVVGADLSNAHPLRRGRYIIMKNSIPGPATILSAYKNLQESYAEEVKQDPTNKIWGEPKDFLKVLYVAPDQIELQTNPIAPTSVLNHQEKNKLKKIINLDEVACVVETAEELLDWNRCRTLILNELKSKKNISIFTDLEVLKLAYSNHEKNFSIAIKSLRSNLTGTMSADYPIISAWERAETLVETLGISIPKAETTTNRLKSIVTAKLPPELENTNSYFFCMGPYAMFSNLGNGLCKVTYAPVTNMQNANADVAMPADMEKFLNGTVPLEQVNAIGQRILDGASQFIPALAKAKLINTAFGIVKTRGSAEEVNIYNPNGKISERDYGGVVKYSINTGFVIIIASMKLTYSYQNGLDAMYLINEALYMKYNKCISPSYNQPYSHALITLQNSMMLDQESLSTHVINNTLKSRGSNQGLRPSELLIASNPHTPSRFNRTISKKNSNFDCNFVDEEELKEEISFDYNFPPPINEVDERNNNNINHTKPSLLSLFKPTKTNQVSVALKRQEKSLLDDFSCEGSVTPKTPDPDIHLDQKLDLSDNVSARKRLKRPILYLEQTQSPSLHSANSSQDQSLDEVMLNETDFSQQTDSSYASTSGRSSISYSSR